MPPLRPPARRGSHGVLRAKWSPASARTAGAWSSITGTSDDHRAHARRLIAAHRTLAHARVRTPRLARLEHLPHPAEHRPRPATAERLAVDRGDGEHFLGRRRQPHLVGRQAPRPGTPGASPAGRPRQRANSIVASYVMPGRIRLSLGGTMMRPSRHDQHVRRRRFGEKAVAEHHGLDRVVRRRRAAASARCRAAKSS